MSGNNMRIDWENEVKFDGKKLFVQAEYDMEWNSLETHKLTKIKHLRAYSMDADNPSPIECSESLKEHVEEIIDDERFNR